jgi:hypothetical protein
MKYPFDDKPLTFEPNISMTNWDELHPFVKDDHTSQMINILNQKQGYKESTILTVYSRYGKAISLKNIYAVYGLICVLAGIIFFG